MAKGVRKTEEGKAKQDSKEKERKTGDLLI